VADDDCPSDKLVSVHDPTPVQRRHIKVPFDSLREWDEWANANCEPAREDDTPVLMGQRDRAGRPRRATHDELMAFIEEFGGPIDAPK
jgi:hypothetical protein